MLTPRDLSRLATALGGLPILGCSEGSPAAEAGLCYGDIILSGNDAPVASWSELLKACSQAPAQIALRVQRTGRHLQLALRVPASLTPRGVLGDPAPLAAASGRAPDDERAARLIADLS